MHLFFITLVDCIPLLSLLLDQILFKGLMMLKGLFSENKNVQILTYQFPSFYYIPNEFSTGSIGAGGGGGGLTQVTFKIQALLVFIIILMYLLLFLLYQYR